MNRILIIGGSVVFLLALIFGVYFFIRGNKTDDLATQKNKLQEAIALAEKKLIKEKGTLDILTEKLRNSFSLAVSVQDQMKKSLDIVKQTDFMFTNPYGSNPELVVKKSTASILINNERRDINLLLLQWQKEIDLLSVEKIDANESEKIKQDVQTIKSFLENLSQLVKGLTPKNSELSQFQIDTYSAQLPSVEVINTVLVSLETAIENFNNNNSQTSNTETNNNPNFPNPSSNTPTVTPEDVITQQEVVVETQTEVVTLQEQLTQIEQQIQQLSPIPTPTPTTEINTTTDPDLENQNTNNENSNNPVNNPNTNQGIIIQPGPPRLIQGTDPF